MWEILKKPFRHIVRARSIADLETPDGFLKLLGIVDMGLLVGANKELRPTSTISITAGTEESVTG